MGRPMNCCITRVVYRMAQYPELKTEAAPKPDEKFLLADQAFNRVLKRLNSRSTTDFQPGPVQAFLLLESRPAA
jgi:hypothetical protein